MLAALVATVLADRRPARALRRQMEVLLLDGTDDAARDAARLFESVFYRLSPFADERLPSVAAHVFRVLGRQRVAHLLAGTAAQLATPAPPPADAEAAAIVAAPDQGHALLSALERLAAGQDWAESARLVEAVWPSVRPIGHYWVYYRMAAVYQRLDDRDAERLMAALAVQIEPASHIAGEPYARLLRLFHDDGRPRDMAELVLRQRTLCPHAPIVDAAEAERLCAEAGALAAPPPAPPGIPHAIFPREPRPALGWRRYGNGVPNGLRELLQPDTREAVVITELADAEVLTAEDTVAVCSAPGTVETGLSVGQVPTLLPRRLVALARAGRAPAELRIDTAVLLSDEFPAPNLCHFLLDHVPRLLLYGRIGIAPAHVTVIGPAPHTDYQRETLARIGVNRWHPTDAPARLRVGRLFVASTCRQLRHPAHWGAAWAVASVRALFDVAPRARSRRLLISRADAAVRRIANQGDVESLLARCGFETIVPGRMRFADQIAAFREATHVVAPHGAGLANILFCAPGTHVLEVFHPHYGTWAYAMVSVPLDLDYASMVGMDGESEAAAFNEPAWPLPDRLIHAGRDMRVDLPELRRWLADTGAL